MRKLLPISTVTLLTFFSFILYIFPNMFLNTEAEENKNAETTNITPAPAIEKEIIVLDAGHGGYDGGSLSKNNIKEADISLALALKTGNILENNGYKVIYTRTSDEVSWESDNVQDLNARIQTGEKVNADYFISLHLNFGESYNDGARGFEIYLDYEDKTIINMAEKLEENLTKLNYSIDRGLKSTKDFPLQVIDCNKVPAMLIEIGFLSDDKDTKYITSQNGQDNISQTIADSIMTTLS